MTSAPNNVIDQLKQAISDSGLSHNELASKTGIPQPTISRFVRGDRTLGSHPVATLCFHLGLELTAKKRRKKNS